SMSFLVLWLTFVSNGCTITIGPYDDTGESAPSKPSVLPAPTGGAADDPPLDEAQQARLEETEWYTRSVIYNGGRNPPGGPTAVRRYFGLH
ncbi:MAG: hypothetical protein L6Q76_30210, partial [Polyangiaceae bacterium]|nr:hypothetical protein [Polyangiaceae bacterium]